MAARERSGWVLKAQMALFRRDRRFALVEHADVAAQREGTDDELGVLARMLALGLPAEQRVAEADRKAQHLDAAGHRHAVVAVFVHGDQHAQCDDEGKDGEHRELPGVSVKKADGWSGQAAKRSAAALAAARALASIASRSASDAGFEGATASKVSMLTA